VVLLEISKYYQNTDRIFGVPMFPALFYDNNHFLEHRYVFISVKSRGVLGEETVDKWRRSIGANSPTENILKVSQADHYLNCFIFV
jgi:hypothetical protein